MIFYAEPFLLIVSVSCSRSNVNLSLEGESGVNARVVVKFADKQLRILSDMYHTSLETRSRHSFLFYLFILEIRFYLNILL